MGEKTLTKEEIIEAISKLSALELAELVKSLEKKFGIEVPQFGAMPASVPQQVAQPQVEEKTEFSVILTKPGPNRIPVIKLVREITALGLKEAKELVDSAPKPIKEGISKKDAEDLKNRFTDLGATVEIK